MMSYACLTPGGEGRCERGEHATNRGRIGRSRRDRERVGSERDAAAAVAEHYPQVGRAGGRGGPDVVDEGRGVGLAAAGAIGGELAAGDEPGDADLLAVVDQGARRG